MKFLHELNEAQALFEIISNELGINEPYLVEKDYWIMHSLWGLQQQGFEFELKGGTSLSKGFKIIDRFSEDIDIHIHPEPMYQLTNKTRLTDKKYIDLRQTFFDNLSSQIKIPGMQSNRDIKFDDELFRNAGISLGYKSFFEPANGIKQSILLEVGFDTVAPNTPIDISSWAYEKAKDAVPNLIDNRAIAVKCYLPEYTFVEKLQAISSKVRKQSETGEFDKNFMRHFYDIHQLFQQDSVKNFIGTESYFNHKKSRFRKMDECDFNKNIAFNFDSNSELFSLYKNKFLENSVLYFNGAPTFDEIYDSILQIRKIG